MQFDLLGKAVRRFRLPTVDYNDAPTIIIPVQEGDVNSRYFDVTLYDDRGNIDLSFYSRAILTGTTPSGITLTTTECEIKEDGSAVIVKFSGGFTAQVGRVQCNIAFVNGSGTVLLTSRTFYVIVSESSTGKIITENQEDYSALVSLFREVAKVESSIETAEASRVAAENERRTAENERIARYDDLADRLDEDLTNIENVASNAAIAKEVYDKMNLLIYFDTNGRPCWQKK